MGQKQLWILLYGQPQSVQAKVRNLLVPLQDINRSWAAFFLEERRTQVIQTFWVFPPNGVVKLNFDGSVNKDMHIQGWGWIIRDTTGQILHWSSGSVACLHANGAEVYAMLMGCHELLKLDIHHALPKVILSQLFSRDLVK